MKTLLALAIAVLTIPSFAQTSWKVDPSSSKIEWLGKKVAGQHNGTIGIKSGILQMKDDLLVGGEIVVDMNSMKVVDITDKETAGKFEGHMKSPDFFDTTKHPEARLVIKGSKKSGKGLEVNGDLTIKGKSQPVTFMAQVEKPNNGVLKANASLDLDRTKWNIKYGSGLIGTAADKIIYDDFNLKVLLTAKK